MEIDKMVVEEIDSCGNVYAPNTPVAPRWVQEEDYVVFVLQKQGWTTAAAISEICKRLRISRKRASFAGTKDRSAITTQLCSIYKLTPSHLENINIKDIRILGAWFWDRPIVLGDLLGNKFKIKLKEGLALSEEKVYAAYGEMGGLFPNFYGPQRFGTRGNTHIVGKLILLGDFEGAVMEYLTAQGNESDEVRAARSGLADGDFKRALKDFPKTLRHERTLLAHLAVYPRDFVGALRRLPRPLLLLFVHAYQAWLFNRVLESKLRDGELIEEGDYYCGTNWYGFPDIERINGKFPVGKLVGLRTTLSARERALLEEEGITQDCFAIKSMPELSSEGGYRPLLAPIKNFSYANGIFEFELPAGSYATTVLKEFLKARK